MSTINRFTHFPISSFPSKFNTFTNSRSQVSSHHPLSSSIILLSHNFFSGEFPIFRRIRKKMGEKVIKIAALQSEDCEEDLSVLEQEALVDGSSNLRFNIVSPEFEATLNRFSKWLVTVLFGVVILWRHDSEAVWAAMGSVLNSVLSVILKRLLNQERPVGNVRADPGMPSSHAQSIFYGVTFVNMSMVEWFGVNEFTVIFAAASLAIGSYLSWLRVAQKLHTIDQIVVGAIVGSCFSLVWLWSWDAVVLEAFNSDMRVRVAIVLASATCCLAFLIYIVRHWLREDRR